MRGIDFYYLKYEINNNAPAPRNSQWKYKQQQSYRQVVKDESGVKFGTD